MRLIYWNWLVSFSSLLIYRFSHHQFFLGISLKNLGYLSNSFLGWILRSTCSWWCLKWCSIPVNWVDLITCHIQILISSTQKINLSRDLILERFTLNMQLAYKYHLIFSIVSLTPQSPSYFLRGFIDSSLSERGLQLHSDRT